MNDDNPYAPPLVADPQAPPARAWYLEGISLIAKNQAALPMVDLNTGEHGGEMKCIRRALLKRNPVTLVGTILLIAAFLILSNENAVDPALLFCGLVGAMFLLKQIEALRASPSQRLHVMEYVGQKSLKGRVARTRWRTTIYLACILLFFGEALPGMTGVAFLPIAFVALIANMIWAILDKPPARSLPGPPGWMKISPIHPEAVRFLSASQNAEEMKIPVNETGVRSRRIRTTYFYKFPLSMLVGRRKNPFSILNITLAKLLRSHLLARDTFHFSEEAPTELTALSAPLQERINYWVMAHPDWNFQAGTRLVSPDGDIIVESAHLTPATLEHDLCITCSWNIAAPARLIFQNSFISWLRDGAHISTHDHSFLTLQDPRSHSFRARGGMEKVYQAHLGNCAGQSLDPPADKAELAARILELKEEADRRLTGLGYQSELR